MARCRSLCKHFVFPLFGEHRTLPAPDRFDANDPFLPSAVQAFRIARCSLLDHLVPGCQQCFRDGKAERLGGLKVDHQFELVRL
jgi:hypothetical protein